MTPSVLESLIATDALTVVFQPIFHIVGDKASAVSVEALTRGPRGTLFESPTVLFEYVRRKRAEAVVDRECTRLSLKAYSSISRMVRLSLNVHASTLGRDPDFAEFMIRQCELQGVSMSQVAVEIVEHSPAWNQDQFLSNLQKLRVAGARVALDDVGLGNSNYRMILDCRPDYFKLDGYIVRGCHGDAGRRAVLSSVAKLAHDLGAEVVAEGVEVAEDLEVVINSGIYMVQGYIFCRALAAIDLVQTGLLTGELSAKPVLDHSSQAAHQPATGESL